MIKEESKEEVAVQTQVVTQMVRLDNQLAELEAAFNALKDRLTPVLRNEALEDDETKKLKVEETLVPFAHDIKRGINQIDGVIREIVSVLERLEI